jgi:PAS domain S-box-containing protein
VNNLKTCFLFIILVLFSGKVSASELNSISKISEIHLYLGGVVILVFIISLYYIIKSQVTYNRQLVLKTQVLDQMKIEELRIYMLIVGIFAPFSEYFISVFQIRKIDELIPNLIVGFVLISTYFLSKKNLFFRKIAYPVFLIGFSSFIFSTYFKLYFLEIDILIIIEFFVILFFAFYIFYKSSHYFIFISFVLLFCLALFFSPNIELQNAMLISLFTIMVIVYNYVRQIILFKQQEKLYFINNIVNNGISIAIASDKNGKITYVSENVKDILGYDPSELLGDGWWIKTIDNTTELENEKEKIINKYVNEEITTRLIKTKNGAYKWIQWHDKKFDDQLIVGIGQDITELKNLEDEQSRRQEKLINQNDILNQINLTQFDETKNFIEYIDEILKIVSEGIKLDIISLLECKENKLEIISMYETKLQKFSKGETIYLIKYPNYFKAISSGVNIIADDVNANEYTQEFVNGYIKEKNIKSLMDIPIKIGGKLKFLISCESFSEFKKWDDDDITFIKKVADYISLTIENLKRKTAEKKVVESENIFRQINETIDNVFWLYDLQKNKVIYISPSCEKILGTTQENFYNTFDYWKKFVLDEDKEYILENHQKITTQGFYEIEYRINKNNEIRWIKEKSYAIQDENGNVVKSSGICTDITNEKLLQLEMKKLSLIAENTTNGVSISDIEGKVYWVNQGYLDMFEISKEEIIGIRPRDLFVKHNQELLDKFEEFNASNYKFEFEATTAKGNKIWVEINNTVINDQNGNFIQQIDVITDITQQVISQQKLKNQSLILEEYTKDLEYQNKLKEKLIHADTHSEVSINTIRFVTDQFKSIQHVSILFPDVNQLYFKGLEYNDGELEEISYFSSELSSLEKAKNGEILLIEDIEKIENKSESDLKYIEKGVVSYAVFPFMVLEEFQGILIIGFTEKLNLSFKQISYLKETCSVVSVTVNQINLNEAIKLKSDDILSSIIYAKNIQTSALPNLKTLSSKIQNVALFYRAKDIVSGDFYWGKDTEDYCYIVIGDCTGHGVPGAFLTLLGLNILEQLIGIEKKTSPAEILTDLDNRLYASLNQNTQDSVIDDGMELGLCVYNKKEKVMQFAGAGLGVLYFYNNEEIHIRGQRTSIGEVKPPEFKFENSQIDITGYEYFYLATDGYQDQLGGPRYKRFSKNRLIALLNEIKFKEADDKERILENTIDEYMGNNEQLDDLTVLSFTIQP